MRPGNAYVSSSKENMNNPSSIDDVQPTLQERNGHINHISHDRPFWQRAIVGIFILGVFYAMYVARAVLLPIIIAALLSFLLAPVKRLLQRWYIPGPIAAGAVVLAMAGVIAYGTSYLAEPTAKWFDNFPKIISKLEGKLYPFKQTVLEVNKAAEQVEKIATPGERPKVVASGGPGIREVLVSGTQAFLVVLVMIGFLVYFFLAAGDMLLRKLVKVLPRLRDKITAVQISQQIQHDVSRYLATVTLINASLGIATGAAMYLLDMPNPVLWGVMAMMFNFVPYIGSMTTLIVLTVVALLTFNQVEQALLVPLVFLAIATIEGQLVTPIVLGMRLALNPLVVFLTIIWWGWFWGVPGALIAVPLLVIIKIICDHVAGLSNVSEFLGR